MKDGAEVREFSVLNDVDRARIARNSDSVGQREAQSEREMSGINYRSLRRLIEECRDETDVDKKIAIFQEINCIVPARYKIRLPSLITTHYVDRVIGTIEEVVSTAITA